ncbi:hypothetical protein ACED66_22275 [Vibrio splendidus]|uniref:hypothetical protein n=1 Tax=Vibrio splendidus TaxID=29497 RepID=UPI00062EB6DC|nr:hypothetical protein [Vibrio splendidus]PTP96477.1 hypothetical protein CWO28_22135 [Vibrio splendidus]CDT82805.1 conserved exported hypothetical protein [Vibrio coralliirubri]
MKFNVMKPWAVCHWWLVLLGSAMSFHATAIEISSMFMVADANGSGTFTIKNTQDKRIFMNVGMSELNVVDGAIVKTPYDRSNIQDWKIDVYPAKTIIDVGHEKQFKVTLKCGRDCDAEQDQLFQLAFVPTPYFDEGIRPKQAVQMAVGFGALFLRAAKEKPIHYKADYRDGRVTINNTGETYLKARVTNCAELALSTQECTKMMNVMPGRQLTIDLPDNMRSKPFVDVYLDTYRDKYSESVRLLK